VRKALQLAESIPRAFAPLLLSLACSVPSPPAEGPEPSPRAEPNQALDPEPPPFSLPPSDRLCSSDCCPRGLPIVQLGSPSTPVAARPSSSGACLVGNADANELTAGTRGDVIVAGAGNDVVHGGPMRDTLLGNDGDDELHAGPGSDHIDAGFGDDVVEGGAHSDLILGGPGADTIHGDTMDLAGPHPGADVIHGGPGSDTIDGGPGEDRILGGVDDDTLRGGPGNDIILGSLGNDVIEGDGEDDWLGGEAGDDTIRGGEGSDRIHPGLGRDEAYGEGGDDTIILMDECEIASGELVDGGSGFDRVVSPWTEEQLVERGIRFTAVEDFVVRGLSRGKMCKVQDPKPRMIEVSGSVVAATTLFRDEQGTPRAVDGLFHTEWDIFTSYTLKVDTVYLGSLDTGAEIDVLLPGGTIELPDGTGRSSIGCGFTSLGEGRRYRLELRELHDDYGAAVGWDYIWHVASPVNHALVLRLADRGPITTA
jgi:Ca2+-binding RTX toxin-like protein